MTVVRRSVHDREIVRLALPALGALAAEPLYLLVDTAIVGHLGTTQLAALALAATVLTSIVALCNFLTYGTTAQVARLHGAGRTTAAGDLGAQALWLALAVGVALTALDRGARGADRRTLLGGDGDGRRRARRATCASRRSALPCALLALAGQGWLRGVGDLRTPLDHRRDRAARANVVLELLFVYGFDLGPRRLGLGHGGRPARDGRGVRVAAAARAGARRAGRSGPASGR